MKRRRNCIGALLAVAMVGQFLAAPASAGGQPPGREVARLSHGVELTLSLSAATFPRNALVRATVRLRNVSAQTLLISPEPWVRVIDSLGTEVYSAGQGTYPNVVPLPGPFHRPGSGYAPPLAVRPGQGIVRHVFLVLRAARLQAMVGLFTPRAPGSLVGTTTNVVGRVMTVRLTHGTPPRITVARQGMVLAATIRPGNPAQRGTLWYMESERCGNSVTGTLDWSVASIYRAGAYHLTTMCTASEWRIAAAWINQPVGSVDWVR